jgi:hypothetical protein
MKYIVTLILVTSIYSISAQQLQYFNKEFSRSKGTVTTFAAKVNADFHVWQQNRSQTTIQIFNKQLQFVKEIQVPAAVNNMRDRYFINYPDFYYTVTRKRMPTDRDTIFRVNANGEFENYSNKIQNLIDHDSIYSVTGALLYKLDQQLLLVSPMVEMKDGKMFCRFTSLDPLLNVENERIITLKTEGELAHTRIFFAAKNIVVTMTNKPDPEHPGSELIIEKFNLANDEYQQASFSSEDMLERPMLYYDPTQNSIQVVATANRMLEKKKVEKMTLLLSLDSSLKEIREPQLLKSSNQHNHKDNNSVPVFTDAFPFYQTGFAIAGASGAALASFPENSPTATDMAGIQLYKPQYAITDGSGVTRAIVYGSEPANSSANYIRRMQSWRPKSEPYWDQHFRITVFNLHGSLKADTVMINVRNTDLILFDQYSIRPGNKNFDILFPTMFREKYNGIIQFSVEPDLTSRSRLLVVKHQYKYDVSKTIWLSDGTGIVPYSTNKICGFARYIAE